MSEGDATGPNVCPKCGQPVPAPFRAHVDNLGGCPEGESVASDD